MAGRSSFGHVRERPDTGRWQARWQDPTGRQHSKTFPTKAKAAQWLRDEASARNVGSWVDPRSGKVTFRAWSDRWRETIVDLRPSTLARDLGYIDRYLLTAFGDTELAAIDHMAVRAWVARLGADHAPATVVKAAQIMGKIMRAAVVAKVIASSPVDGVRLPKIEREEMRFLTPEQVWRLVDVFDERYRAVVLLGAYGGLRAGEMFGLQVGRVDVLRRTVRVAEHESNLTETGGHSALGPPKTRASVRTVPLPEFVIAALTPHLGGHPGDMVFTAPGGGFVYRSSWRSRFWVPAITAAGLGGLRIHDLRHTAVALWLAAGASPLEVARRAGHSSTVTVLDRYGHLLPGAEDRVTDALDAMGVRRPIDGSDGRSSGRALRLVR